MAHKIYICNNCLNNNKPIGVCLFSFTFNDKNFETIKNNCAICNSTDLKWLELTNEDYHYIINTSTDLNFILAMDELKRNDIIEFNLKLAQMKQTISQENKPKCPTCGSTNIEKISGTKRWVGTGIFGLASSNLGKTMCCNSCGYEW